MPPLPAPTVDVTPAADRDSSAPAGSVDVVISREGKGRSYRTVGGSTVDVVRDAVRKVLNDPYTAEFLPAKGERS
jgi:hypothetical protein